MKKPVSTFFLVFFLLFIFSSARAQFTLVYPMEGQVIGPSQTHFIWNRPAGFSEFRLEIYNNQLLTSSFYRSGLLTSDSTSVFGFTPGNAYWWRAVAYDAGGDSITSPVRSFVYFHPSVFAGLRIWLNAENGPNLGSGSSVLSWADISGNSFLFQQSNPSKRPVFNADPSGTATPSVYFNGALKSLAGNITLNATPVLQLFSFHRPAVTSGLGIVYELSPDFTGSPGGMIFYHDVPANTEVIGLNGNVGFDIIAATGVRDSIFFLYNVTFNRGSAGNEVSARINGAPLSASTLFNADNTNTFASDLLSIGARNAGSGLGFRGDLSEMILYENTLSIFQQQLVESYLHDHNSPPVCLGRDVVLDSVFCFTYVFNPPIHEYTAYLWSTGATTPSITVNNYGSYWLRTTDQLGRVSFDTIEFRPRLRLVPDTAVCPSDSVLMDLSSFYGGNQVIFQWYDGSYGNSHYIAAPGTYWVSVTDSSACFSYVDTFQVFQDTFALTASLGPDTALCSGNLLQLDQTAGPGAAYSWSTGSTDSVATVTTTGNYWIQATNILGCTLRDTVFITVLGQAPLVDFDVQAACINSPAIFTDQSSSSNNLQQWNWDFGDNTTSVQQHPTHAYAGLGTYAVRLSVTTDVGCTNDTLIMVTVHDKPTAQFIVSDTCERWGTRLYNQSIANEGSIVATHWDFGDLSTNADTSSQPLPVYSYPAQGIYQPQLIAFNSFGCADTADRIVHIQQGPVANFSYNKECFNDPVQFTNLSSVGSPLVLSSYMWNFTPSDSSVQINPVFTFTAMGSYPVTLLVGADNGCYHRITDTLVIDKYVNAGFLEPEDSVCRYLPYAFMDTSVSVNTTITSWAWRFDDQGNSSAQNPSFAFTEAGWQQVRLIVQSADNCVDSAKQLIFVKTPPVAGFSMNQQVGVPPLDVIFTNTSSPDVQQFQWDLGDGNSSLIPNPVHEYADTGSYNVMLVVTDGLGCSDTAYSSILVARPSYNVLLQGLICTNVNGYMQFATTLLNQSNLPLQEIEWRAGLDNQLQLSETWNGSLNPGQYLPYTFTGQTLITPGTEICCVQAYQVFSALGDSILQETICVPLINEFTVLEPYPNPSSGQTQMYIILPVAQKVELRLADNLGRLIWVNEFNGVQGVNTYTVDMSHLAAGGYHLAVYFQDQCIQKPLIRP